MPLYIDDMILKIISESLWAVHIQKQDMYSSLNKETASAKSTDAAVLKKSRLAVMC